MSVSRILCSTGALIGRPNGRNFRLLEGCTERLKCDGFEFMMYSTWYDQVDELIGYLKGLRAVFPVVHLEKGIGECISRNEPGDTEEAIRRFRINCGVAEAIGASKLVLHLWSGIHSDKDIGHNMELYGQLRPIADEHGLKLTVENVVCNHEDPFAHMQRLIAAYPDVQFTFDTKMAEFHGQMDCLYGAAGGEVFQHIAHMHINDYRGGCMDWNCLRTLHPGDGQIDFDRLFAFLKEKKYQGDFTVEATSFGSDGVIDFDALNRDFAGIRSRLA